MIGGVGGYYWFGLLEFVFWVCFEMVGVLYYVGS